MTEISVTSRDGLRLEGLWGLPDDPRASLVFCHPHPEMGGTMNAPLLAALAEHLIGQGWAVLRFNFRGVGASEGESSTGEAEVADALGAVDLARASAPDVPVAIAGWSFGGAVAVRACAEDESIVACAAIAPAVVARSGQTAGLSGGDELRISVPLLVVCGSNDEQVPPDACRRWAATMPTARYEEMAGANHFFWAKYEKLAALVGGFLNDSLVKGGPS